MKQIMIILCLVLIVAVSNAVADYGPYYVRDSGYCTEYKLYITPDNFLYGTEFGCAYLDNRAPSSFIGILDFQNNSLYIIDSAPELTNADVPRNSMLIIEYNFYTMIAKAYITDGHSFEYYSKWGWTLSLN